MKRHLMLLVLAATATLPAYAGPNCSPVQPSICDPHTTTSTTWSCNDGGQVCCKIKAIEYTCPPSTATQFTQYRWYKANSLCGGVDANGEPQCIPLS